MKRDNRARLAKIPDNRPDLAHALASEPTHVLKVAAIFQAAIVAAQRSPTTVTQIKETALACAIAHVAENLRATEYLFRRAKQFEARQQAEEILSKICNEFPRSKRFPDTIFVNRSDLTATFCHNTTRKGALTVDDLYLSIIPEMIRQGQAQLCLKKGRFEVYAFRVSDSDDDGAGGNLSTPANPPETHSARARAREPGKFLNFPNFLGSPLIHTFFYIRRYLFRVKLSRRVLGGRRGK